jgi:serine/threonine-protein kinase
MSYPDLSRYKIVRKVCRRLCYTLFVASDNQTGARTSVKVLDDALAKDRSHVNKFSQAARIGSVIKHDGIPTISYFGKDQDYYIVASECDDLKPLSLFIHEEFPLALQTVLDIVGKISQILRHAHLQGVIHGLLNPGSIFVDAKGELKIDDFGYHWLAPYLHELEDAEALYLSYHIASEVYRGQELDGRADMYSLGVILLQLVTDNFPFNALDPITIPNQGLHIGIESIRRYTSHYPKRIERILARTLQPNPERRFQNLQQFESQIAKLRDEYSYEMELANLENEWLQPENDI